MDLKQEYASITVAGRALPVRQRVNARAKRLVLRLSPAGDEIRLTVPPRISKARVEQFLLAQQVWLENQLAQKPLLRELEPGMTLPLFGQDCLLMHAPQQRGVVYEETVIYIGGGAEHFSRRMRDWVRKEALKRFGDMARELAVELEVSVAGVSLKEMKSRWGSCSVERKIVLNWRLAFAPPEVAFYVIAHEVAHLVHFDHSPAFWRCVAGLDPSHMAARRWLKRNGAELHRWR